MELARIHGFPEVNLRVYLHFLMQQVVQFEKKLQGFLWLNFVLWVLDALVYDQSAGVMIHQGGYLIPWIELNGQDSNINYLQEQSF